MTREAAGLLLGGYLLGSVSFAAIIVRWKLGIDLRTVGSGNLGATNAARVLGRTWGMVIYALDFLKGLIPVLLAARMDETHGFGPNVPSLPLLSGLLAFIGHCLPIWHGFRGGKGVATASGLVVGLAPWPVSASVVGAFALGVGVSRTISLGSVLAAAVLPLSFGLMEGRRALSGTERFDLIVFAFIGLFVIYRHRANMGRLLRGEEPRIGRKAK